MSVSTSHCFPVVCSINLAIGQLSHCEGFPTRVLGCLDFSHSANLALVKLFILDYLSNPTFVFTGYNHRDEIRHTPEHNCTSEGRFKFICFTIFESVRMTVNEAS